MEVSYFHRSRRDIYAKNNYKVCTYIYVYPSYSAPEKFTEHFMFRMGPMILKIYYVFFANINRIETCPNQKS